MVAVGFSSRIERNEGQRRGATLEVCFPGGQASLRDAPPSCAGPWAEAHGYHHEVAPRPTVVPALKFRGEPKRTAAGYCAGLDYLHSVGAAGSKVTLARLCILGPHHSRPCSVLLACARPNCYAAPTL